MEFLRRKDQLLETFMQAPEGVHIIQVGNRRVLCIRHFDSGFAEYLKPDAPEGPTLIIAASLYREMQKLSKDDYPLPPSVLAFIEKLRSRFTTRS